MKAFLFAILFALCIPLAAQTPTFDEMTFEPDSVKAAYKPSGKNYVYMKSKRGSNGMNKTAIADAITSAEVTEIVLVFSELDASAIETREEANRERWENLLSTYPEFFQFSTTYKNLCQCNAHGDSAAFKKAQGFYIYVNGEVPKTEEAKAPENPPAAAVTKTEEKKPEEKKAPQKEAPAVSNTGTKTKTEPLKTEAPAITAAKETPVEKETPPVKEAPAVTAAHEETPAAEAPVVKENSKRKPAATKARKAKDPKACRPACYGWGDEDLIDFFAKNVTLTKKQKKKGKNLLANVKLQLDVDGSIKKTMVTGENDTFNKQVEDVIKMMNSWNCAVKNGTAVKSEVKLTLKFDKPTKSIRPYDILINPKLPPKCKCMSDSEVFGSD